MFTSVCYENVTFNSKSAQISLDADNKVMSIIKGKL